MSKIYFYDYYYYSDLIICSFCLEYMINYFDILEYEDDFDNIKHYYYYLNDYYFIFGAFNFICTDCIFMSNNIVFLNDYVLYKNNDDINEIFDFYEEYFECYNNCFACYLYYIDYFYYYRCSDTIFCEFEKDYFYYEINYYDYYDLYKYCYNLDCICCLKYFFLKFQVCECFEDTIYFKNKNKEMNVYYDFHIKEEEDIFEIMSPEEIYLFLNKFVMGQEKAKKLVSVSIYIITKK